MSDDSADLTRLRRQTSLLSVLHLSEWVLVVLTAGFVTYLLYGKLSARGVIPGHELVWRESLAMSSGMVIGVAYAAIHAVHAGFYKRFSKSFVEITHRLDQFVDPLGANSSIDAVVKRHQKAIEPAAFSGFVGFSLNIAIGVAVVVLSRLLVPSI